MLNIAVNGYGKGLFVGRQVAEAVGEYHLLAWLLLDGVAIIVHAKKHVLRVRMFGMYGLMLYHPQMLVVILDGNIPAI